MNADNLPGDAQERQPGQTKTDDTPVAWEQLEPGRYMPRPFAAASAAASSAEPSSSRPVRAAP